MRVGIKLTNLKQAEKKIANELIKAANKALKASLDELKDYIQAITKKLMYKSRFFNEILFGDLKGHFGIPENQVSSSVDNIIDEIVNNIEIFYSPLSTYGGRTKVRGGIKIGIGKNGFASLLSMSEGMVKTGIKGQAITLHWLDWVLRRGDEVIVSEHDIEFETGSGRSGLAIMVPDKTASWRVPADFSGTLEDNVITREILRNLEIYSDIVQRIITKHFNNI